MIETIDLGQKERLKIKEDYYWYTLYIPTGEILRVKNAGCEAILMEYLENRYNINMNHMSDYKNMQRFFHGTNPNLDLGKVYKKYHKYFQNVEV